MALNNRYLAFVYGTLKRCQPNAAVMSDVANGKAVFKGKGQTTSKYPLVVATEYNVPFLLKVPGQGYEIPGEVYEIDDSMLQFLDKFEGHPDLYRREDISVKLIEDQNGRVLDHPEELQCSTYFLCRVKEDFLQLKWLKEFSYLDSEASYVPKKGRTRTSLKTLVFPDES